MNSNEEGILALYAELEKAIENYTLYIQVGDTKLAAMWMEIIDGLEGKLMEAGE
jgi:hypothetical protein